jgi:hypothetical protein
VNGRIKRCTFSLPAVCNPSTAHATAAPFHTRNRAPTNAAAFTATVTVVLTDIHGVERVVVLTHDTAVSKQVCTTVYEALESVVAQPNPPQHVWTKVNYGNCYVPHSDVGSDVQPLLAPEGSGLGPALSLGVVEENLGEIGRGSFGAVFKVTPCFDLIFPLFFPLPPTTITTTPTLCCCLCASLSHSWKMGMAGCQACDGAPPALLARQLCFVCLPSADVVF